MAKTAKTVASPVTIIGKGRVKASGQPVYAATSASTPGRVYLIAWTTAGWECGCAQYQFRRTSCAHVRALSARLADELRRRDAETAAANIGPDDTFTLTDKGRAALAEWRQRKVLDLPERLSDTAPRRQQSFPASLLK